MTWNVNGYRSVYGKGLTDWVLASRPDALLLQEVRVHPQQLTEHQRSLPGYCAFWNPAAKPGYSGVATFLLEPVEGIRYGLGDAGFDDEGRVIRTRHEDFLLYNVYFPSGRRGQERVAFKLDFYAHLLEICDRLHAQGEKIILAGDFNTVHEEIDLVLHQNSFVRQHDLSKIWHSSTKSMQGLKLQT